MKISCGLGAGDLVFQQLPADFGGELGCNFFGSIINVEIFFSYPNIYYRNYFYYSVGNKFRTVLIG